jgi:hypothetical protein
MRAHLTADPSGRGMDHDDLVDAITSTMRVIDCVLMDAAPTRTTPRTTVGSPR